MQPMHRFGYVSICSNRADSITATYSSDLFVGILTNVCRNDSTRQANSKATNNSSNIQLSKIMALAQSTSRLNNTANNEDQIRKHQSSLATQLIAQVKRARSSEEASSLEDRNDIAGQTGVIGTVHVEAKTVVERLHREHSADKTGVPPK
jgi:hypothetical protein